jgi:dTDP-4-amino-4,6-dideoxygalactose transaminase
MPYYRKLGWSENDFPFAENYYKNCISIPMFPTLSETNLTYIIKTINKFYE